MSKKLTRQGLPTPSGGEYQVAEGFICDSGVHPKIIRLSPECQDFQNLSSLLTRRIASFSVLTASTLSEVIMALHNARFVSSLSQLKLQCPSVCRTLVTSSNLERVPSLYALLSSRYSCKPFIGASFARRTYAERPVSRPKAHTGRTTKAARKAPTTSATKAAKKPAERLKTPKAKPKDGTGAKPRIKPKPKPRKKAKAKPKPKPKKKEEEEVLTAEQKKEMKAAQKKKAQIKKLKATALSPPHDGASSTPWAVLFQEVRKARSVGGYMSFGPVSETASAQYKQLSPEQLEVSPTLVLG